MFFGTNTSQRDFPKMTGHFSVQIHPSTILLGHFSVQIHPSTIFLCFTTQRALIFDRHKTSLECTAAHGPARTARGSTPGTAGESSSGQCAAAHGRPRAVCNPATAAWSERTADWPSPERTADGPSPAGSASQCSAVIVWGERSARWSIRSLRETTAADSAVQSRLSADHATHACDAHAHTRLVTSTRTHARAHTHTTGTTGLTQ